MPSVTSEFGRAFSVEGKWVECHLGSGGLV